MDMKRVGTWERTVLRIHGAVVEQEIWRIRTKQQLRELQKDLDIVAHTKKKRLQWIGHAVRMDQKRTVNKRLRVNWREEEWEDLDRGGCKMMKGKYTR